MNLYRIYFRHYSQKDSKEGTSTYLIADNDEQVMAWLSEEAGWDFLDDRDMDTLTEYFGTEFEKPGDRERAEALGLTIDPEYGDVKGTKKALILFTRGETGIPSELYYGCTQWFWELAKEHIEQHEALVLTDLGLAVVHPDIA